MRDTVAVTAAQETKVIRASGDVRQEGRDLHAALPVQSEGPARRQQFVLGNSAAGLERSERFWNGLPGQPNQIGFGIEEIDVAWASGHEKENDASGPGQKMRRSGRERVRR